MGMHLKEIRERETNDQNDPLPCDPRVDRVGHTWIEGLCPRVAHVAPTWDTWLAILANLALLRT